MGSSMKIHTRIKVRTIPRVCMRAGQHFVAVLGAQQSVLEAVLLKRRVMGPSWLALARPTRTDAAKQASTSPHAPWAPALRRWVVQPCVLNIVWAD